MSTWTDAKQKRTDRRNEGANCTVVPALVTQLDTAMKTTLGQAANNTNNTYVIAYLASQNVYMAVGIPVPNRATLVQTLNTNLRPNPLLTEETLLWLTRETNLHAEMAVVNHVCATYALGKGNLGGDLTICCTGKGCCADCCGWMTRYRIDHGPVCNAEGSQQGWKHPLTGATFRGNGNEFTYQKPSKYQGSATSLNKDPKRI
jgi:hypothetical protein